MITAKATYTGRGLMRAFALQADTMEELQDLADCWAPAWTASTTLEIDTDWEHIAMLQEEGAL